MTRALVFRPEARSDLIAIADFVSDASVARARQLVGRLRTRCDVLLSHPLAGRPRDELGEGLRSLAEQPYIILYRVVGDTVEIIGFLHGARHLPSALRGRLENDTN